MHYIKQAFHRQRLDIPFPQIISLHIMTVLFLVLYTLSQRSPHL